MIPESDLLRECYLGCVWTILVEESQRMEQVDGGWHEVAYEARSMKREAFSQW